MPIAPSELHISENQNKTKGLKHYSEFPYVLATYSEVMDLIEDELVKHHIPLGAQPIGGLFLRFRVHYSTSFRRSLNDDGQIIDIEKSFFNWEVISSSKYGKWNWYKGKKSSDLSAVVAELVEEKEKVYRDILNLTIGA